MVTVPLTLFVVIVWTGWLRWERLRKNKQRALEGGLDGTSIGDVEAGNNVLGMKTKVT